MKAVILFAFHLHIVVVNDGTKEQRKKNIRTKSTHLRKPIKRINMKMKMLFSIYIDNLHLQAAIRTTNS